LISVVEDDAQEIKNEIRRGEVCDFVGELIAPRFDPSNSEENSNEDNTGF